MNMRSYQKPIAQLQAIKLNAVLCSVMALSACGTGNQSQVDNNTADLALMPYATLRDTNPKEQYIGGDIDLRLNTTIEDTEQKGATTLSLYWADNTGALLLAKPEPLTSYDLSALTTTQTTIQAQLRANIPTPNELFMPENAAQLALIALSADNKELARKLIRVHDFRGNAGLSGTGGNEKDAWHYSNAASDRPLIPIHRQTDGLCVFDNGLVSVIDMKSERDLVWEYSEGPNTVDDHAFPPYMFTCDENPSHIGKEVGDENGVWTYSVLNDSMYYGTLVYDMFLRQLGEPPLEEKIRLRVHYGAASNTTAIWDGAYASFGDAMPFYYSMASLDIIAHEIAHGVLDRISQLKAYRGILSDDARTVHEAFADISGVMAKFSVSDETDHWIHSKGYYGNERHLDKIETEPGAILNYSQYDNAGDNYYLRIGMFTYPFYVLSQHWGLDTSYAVYVHAARTCWTAQTTLPEAAECIHNSATIMQLSGLIVTDSFAKVGITL